MISYRIIDFNTEMGQITVLVEGFAPYVIDLYPNAANQYPTGTELDEYVRGFLPIAEIERRRALQSVINAHDISQLVDPLPPAPPPPPPDMPVEPIVYIV